MYFCGIGSGRRVSSAVRSSALDGFRSCEFYSVYTVLDRELTFRCSFFFFGGLSIPLSQAILAHMFSYNITWSATKKEVERSNFFKEVPKICKRCVSLFFFFQFDLRILLGLECGRVRIT